MKLVFNVNPHAVFFNSNKNLLKMLFTTEVTSFFRRMEIHGIKGPVGRPQILSLSVVSQKKNFLFGKDGTIGVESRIFKSLKHSQNTQSCN